MGVLERPPTRDSIFLVVDFSAHASGDHMTGRNSLSDISPTCVQLFDYCASHDLSMTKIMFEHKGIQYISAYGTRTPYTAD